MDFGFSPRGDRLVIAAATGVGKLRIRDTRTGKLIHDFESKPDDEAVSVLRFAFTPDGRHLLTVGYNSIARLWDTRTKRLKFELEGHRDWIQSAAVSPDGKLGVTGGDDPDIRFWNLADGKQLASLKAFHIPHDRVYCLAFSPDGRRFASGTESAVRIWSLAGEQVVE